MGSLNFNLGTNAFKNAVKSKVIETSEEIFADSQQNIIDKNIVDRGTLLNSGKFFIGDDFVSITYDAIHSSVIEFGRSPGTYPNITAIKEWVERKGIQARDSNDRLMTSKQLAFLIARDIKENGQEPRPFLSPAIEKAIQKIKNG